MLLHHKPQPLHGEPGPRPGHQMLERHIGEQGPHAQGAEGEKPRLSGLGEKQKEQGIDMLFYMLTNILTQSTTLLCAGQGARQMVSAAFHVGEDQEKDGEVLLPNVVSRKKQLIPVIMMTLQG